MFCNWTLNHYGIETIRYKLGHNLGVPIVIMRLSGLNG